MIDDAAFADDAVFMRRAIELAERGWGRVAPNPLVGAVVVRDGRIVGEGWHAEFGGPHAEVAAIQAAGDAARDGTLFVSLEPCSHHGKTPPCTDAILAAGIRSVVYACADPSSLARGGDALLRDAGVEVRSGVEEATARSLNAAFLRAHDPSAPVRPWTELKLALSLDGRIADLSRRSAWITGDEARAEVHKIRAGHDAVAVGVGTAIADDPSLTARGEPRPRRQPVRIVFDRNLRLPPAGRLATSANELPVWVVCSPTAPAGARATLEAAGVTIIEAVDLGAALTALAREGIRSLLCEGGAELASALLEANLVDRLTLIFAPLLLGANGLDPFSGLSGHPLDEAHRWTPVRTRSLGPDTLISVDR